MHYYQFNIGDYASHTQHLDEIEDLAYRRMLDYCYLNEIGLPESVEEVARLIRMRTHCERIANVLREFFTRHGDGCWRHDRVDREIAGFREKSDKSRKAARKRWGNDDADALPTDSEGNADAMQTQCQPVTNNHKPITINQEPVTNKQNTHLVAVATRGVELVGFDDFYSAYPKKVGRDDAFKAWKKLNPDTPLINRILDDIKNRVEQGAWCTGSGKAFIPGPAPYLNQKKWLDEIIPRPEFRAPQDFSRIAREAQEV